MGYRIVRRGSHRDQTCKSRWTRTGLGIRTSRAFPSPVLTENFRKRIFRKINFAWLIPTADYAGLQAGDIVLQANGINCTKFGHQQVAQIIAESEKFLRMKILPDERKGSLVDWLSVHSKKKVECGVILYADFNIGVSSAEICTNFILRGFDLDFSM